MQCDCQSLPLWKIRELARKTGIYRQAPATCAFRTAGAQVPVQHFTALFLIFISDPQHPIWKRFIVIKEYTSCFHVAALWICSGLCILLLNLCTLKLMGDVMCKASQRSSYILFAPWDYNLCTFHSLFCFRHTCTGVLLLSSFCLHCGPYCSSSLLQLAKESCSIFVFCALPVKSVVVYHV